MLAFAVDGSFYVADWENSRIERFDAAFNATDAWSTGFHSFGVAVDQVGRVFAPDFDHRLVEAYTPQGAALGQIGTPGSPVIDIAPKQVAMARTGPPSLYVLGTDGIERVDLADTPPPPQGGADSDLISVLALGLILVVVGLAVLSRRQRRRPTALLHAPLERPVGLHAENGAQRQQQQSRADEDLLVTHQPEREQ
jgi:hypothetical protein